MSPRLPAMCLLGIIGLGLYPALGQEFLFREFTTMDGLSHSTVFCTFQDRQGYLWFGTYEALHKFDGQQFREPLKKTEITTNRVRRISQGAQDSLWVATHDGAIQLQSEGAKVLTQADGLIHTSVNDIYSDAQQQVWFATNGGLSRLSAQGEWDHFTTEEGLPDNHVRRLVPGEDGILWIATLGGLALFDGQFVQTFELPSHDSFPAIYALEIDDQGHIWLGTTTGLFCLTPEGAQQFGLGEGLPAENIWALEIDRQGRIWVGSDAGLCVGRTDDLRQGHGQLERISESHYIGFTTIYSIDADREGNLWFGTCIGLFQLTAPALQAFNFKGHDAGEMVLSILETEPGTMWFGTDRGVLRQREGDVQNVTANLDLPDTFVRSMIAAPGGGIWLGTRAGAALRGPTQPMTLNRSNGLPDNIIFSLFQSDDGWLYLGTQSGGLAAWRNGEIKTWGEGDGLSGLRVYCMVPHPQGGLLIGTDRGIDWLRDGRLTRINLPLPSCEVYAMVTDQEGVTWAGTHLGVIAIKANKTRIYGVDQGLPDNRCRQLLIDGKNQLWIGTSRGLAMLDGHHFTNFHPPPPTQPFEMNHGAAIADHRGDLWFGQYRGALRFQPDYYSANAHPLPIYLTGVSVFDQNQATDQPLALKYDRNQITFGFQGLHYRDPERIRYRYRLAGRDSEWHTIGATQVTYRDLKPGQYKFEVHAGNPTGSWSLTPASLAIAIHPPFWSQWWFRLISLLVLAAFIYWQFRQMRLHNQLLTQKANLLSAEVARETAAKLEREAEVKLLHSQMNPHFLQNAFTSAIYLVQTAPQKAEDMLHQLSQLFRRTMQAKRKVWSTLGEECGLITDYLAIQKVRFGDRLVVDLICPDELKVQPVPAFILQPLVENACIHGQRETLGQLQIQVICRQLDTGILMTVTNNGQPFESEKGPTFREGHALDNINRRLALLNQELLMYKYRAEKHHFSVFVEPPSENDFGR